jgi:pimeloyl-ACP methyl ester carboxylesterase
VVLVDLRQHGASQHFAPPHTLAAAATDLRQLADATQRPLRAILGHSFGGKVALLLGARTPPALAQLWIVDSTPDAGPPRGSAWSMLGMLQSSPATYATRDAAVSLLIGQGVAPVTAQWMATNLERVDGGLRWRFDLSAMEALLVDFFRTDAWAVVENPPVGLDIHFIKASESSVLTAEAQDRIRDAGPAVHLHEVAGGHWLNADNPQALVALLAEHLPE